MKISVIATVLNEGAAIELLLASLASQTRLPDEVIIADGGSTDGTLEMLVSWAQGGRLALRVLEATGANTSEGRNRAIEAATGDIIASVDAGVRLEENWLEALTSLFETDGADGSVTVVSGWFVADSQTPFETAMGATVLPHLREVKPESFLPSSRSVAFRKEAWREVGGYPEWIDYCEDLIFDLRLRHEFGSFAFAPEAMVHFRPRGNLRAFFKQYYRYARGDGKADLWRKRHAVRYMSYLVVGPCILLLALFHSSWWWCLLATAGGAYLFRPFSRLSLELASLGRMERIQAVLLVPVIRVVGDLAKMLGYPVGLWWRWRNRHRPEVVWRR